MPYYKYKELNSGVEVEVLRSITTYDVPPQPGEDYDPETIPDPKWERVLAGGSTWVQAPGYRAGGKGSRGGFVPRTTKRMPDSI